MDKLSPERRSANMSRIRSKDTKPEMAVRRLVHRMGFRFRLHVPTLPGKPDLVFPRLKRIIDVRGCFWHSHEKCIDSHVPGTSTAYWTEKLQRNRNRDVENEHKLKEAGYSLLVVWECELKDLTGLAERISRFLR